MCIDSSSFFEKCMTFAVLLRTLEKLANLYVYGASLFLQCL